ncbi:uncharacterized protein LOC119318209 isoform X2 [Triticum dicoccoides]|uniref:uncharacterized protein LOC119318209 isoform X2 n=1 Tax=Triticum dicoccoides TaxID=85692 RepID=UPI001890E8BB|nr:uncharacterized protein LOC119318209 isoform X2 [Triticum dicoccoides]
MQMNSSQRKLYHDRDRYLQMTPYQREAYLQRNREYKRMRHECRASCNNTQPAPQQKILRATNNNQYMTGEEVMAISNYERHDSVFTQLGSSSKVAENGGSETSRPKAGTRFTISPSGIYLSSISSEEQAAKYELKNVGQRKRQHCTNVYSQLSHDQEETHVQEICGPNKRKRPEKESCSTARDPGRNTNNLHEDIIYVPQDYFPVVHDYLANTKDNIECDEVDDESLMYNGPGLDFESYQEPKHVTKCIQADPYDRIYHNVPSGHHFLERVPNCRHCNAKRFQYETPTFCCMNGKVKIVTPVVPDDLRQLYTSQDPNAKYFQDHIRYFNSHFSFTSLGVILDQRFCNRRSGVYTFRAQGQIYHRIDQLVPKEDGPKHLQLYFYDTDADLQQRFLHSPNLNQILIRKLVNILSSNPYVQIFRHLGSIPNLDEYMIELNTDIALDQRVYNAPTTSQVAAIWVEGNNPRGHFDRSIMVYGKSDKPQYIKAYHGCYDPLSYPLFFPKGEVGWNLNLPKVGPHARRTRNDQTNALNEEGMEKSPGSCVSPREYYCYKL